MELTPENKIHIDNLTYHQLLSHWRFAHIGDPWFQGETGKYWEERMREIREKVYAIHVATSKDLG